MPAFDLPFPEELLYNSLMGKYDNAYKYLFKNKRIFYQLITSFVKEDFVNDITLENIELMDKSFVSEEFLARESDVIYKINMSEQEVYIFILLEFQSTVDKTIPVRMLSYLFQFYDLLQRDSQKGKLPSIFPLLLYNGSEDWTIPVNINELIDHTIPEKYIPNFEYYLIVEKDIPDEVLERLHNLISAIIYLEKRRDEEGLREAIDKVVEMIQEENIIDIRMFTIWFKRMFYQKMDFEEAEKISNLTEVRYMLTSVAEDIEKKAKMKIAKKMKEEGDSIEKIARITGLPVEEIKKL